MFGERKSKKNDREGISRVRLGFKKQLLIDSIPRKQASSSPSLLAPFDSAV
jgi:hypothetical protein